MMFATECIRSVGHWCNLAPLSAVRAEMVRRDCLSEALQNVALLSAWKAGEVSLTPPDRKPEPAVWSARLLVAGESYCFASVRSAS